MAITQRRLKDVMSYDPNTGIFIWIKRTGPRSKLGGQAGRPDTHGHIQIMINKQYYFAHRLAFLYMLGELPPDDKVVDHINGIRGDNRWVNLRVVTQSVNQQNRHRANKNSTSGLLGAFWCNTRKLWRSDISIDGKRVNLGMFSTPEKANAAYLKARRV